MNMVFESEDKSHALKLINASLSQRGKFEDDTLQKQVMTLALETLDDGKNVALALDTLTRIVKKKKLVTKPLLEAVVKLSYTLKPPLSVKLVDLVDALQINEDNFKLAIESKLSIALLNLPYESNLLTRLMMYSSEAIECMNHKELRSASSGLLTLIRMGASDDEHDIEHERALRNIVLVDVDAVFEAKPVATILTSLVKTTSQRRLLLLETLFTLLDTPRHEKSVLRVMQDAGAVQIFALTLPLVEWKDENKFRLTELLRKMLSSKQEHDDATREALTKALSELLSPIGTDQRVKDECSLIVRSLCTRSSYHGILSPVVRWCLWLFFYHSFSYIFLRSNTHSNNTTGTPTPPPSPRDKSER